MKRLIIITSLLLLVSLFANANSYKIDDNAVETLFVQAKEVSILNTDLSSLALEISLKCKPEQLQGSDNPIIAFVLCFFLGGFGVHRLYLGTGPLVFVFYCCTGGGCSILSCGDLIVLFIGLIKNDVSRYVYNSSLIMW